MDMDMLKRAKFILGGILCELTGLVKVLRAIRNLELPSAIPNLELKSQEATTLPLISLMFTDFFIPIQSVSICVNSWQKGLAWNCNCSAMSLRGGLLLC